MKTVTGSAVRIPREPHTIEAADTGGLRTMVKPHTVTALLLAWGRGDESALERLVPLVDTELRQVARRHMAREARGHTLQTTALINEAYLRLVERPRLPWQNRAHFFAMAARLMRHILVDHARAKRNLKRGGGLQRVPLHDDAGRLAAAGVRRRRAGRCARCAGGDRSAAQSGGRVALFWRLEVEETAGVLNVSPETVMRDWKLARVWLRRELERTERRAP